MNITTKFDTGRQVKDIITGFRGMITGISTYITGCDMYLVQPKVGIDKKIVEPRWFDESRLEYVGSLKRLILKIDDPGACEPAPMK